MRCYECGGQYREKTGTLTESAFNVGTFEVHDVKWLECSSCRDRLYGGHACEAIERAQGVRQQELIGRLPLDEFVSGKEVEQILGVTKQALHKNRRFRRGFVYRLRKWRRILYHRRSVEMFRDRGDGRFPLAAQATQEQAEAALLQPYDGPPSTARVEWSKPPIAQAAAYNAEVV